MASKYSKVFPADVNPVREGVYQRRSIVFGWRYAYWDGHTWYNYSANKYYAVEHHRCNIVSDLPMPWRGLSKRTN